MQPYEFIEGFQEVIDRFGRWPSFHDGEIHRIILDRTVRSACGSYTPSVEIHLRGWIMGSEVTDEGHFKLHHDSVVRFLFEDIFDLELEGFNQQNVLSSLNLSLAENPVGGGHALHVELEHCYLFCGKFSARKARIMGIAPYVPPSTTG